MRKYTTCSIIYNKIIAPNIYDMRITFDEDLKYGRAGQFAQLFIPKGENLLPRPISLCEIDKDNKELRLIYQVVGEGTKYFTTLKQGDSINIIAPIGNGFNISKDHKKIAIVGGGVGTPPMLGLVKNIIPTIPDANIDVFLGFRSNPILIEDFKKLGVQVHVATDDGSVGFKGNVIDLMNSLEYTCDIIYSCGPPIMLKFLVQWANKKDITCYVSMEARMACGLGVCVGCALPVYSKNDDSIFYKKVCKEGPVFLGKEVAWDEL